MDPETGDREAAVPVVVDETMADAQEVAVDGTSTAVDPEPPVKPAATSKEAYSSGSNKTSYTPEHVSNIFSALDRTDEQENFCHGTYKVQEETAASSLRVFYRDSPSSTECRFLQLPPTTEDAIQPLLKACSPASFGRGNEDVLDPSYRNALRLNTEDFAINFSPDSAGILGKIQEVLGDADGDDKIIPREIHAELYKLNVYAPGGFFKSHKDTPRADNMFGSLVVCLPCEHEGGELILRQESGDEHVCNWGTATTTTTTQGESGNEKKSFACHWVAFYSEIEHEILPVKSGHRITLTYNLYFRKSTSTSDAESTRLDLTTHPLYTTLQGLLNDSTFLPQGGILAANLTNSYPIPNPRTLSYPSEASINKIIRPNLKGYDRTLFQIASSLKLTPKIKGEVEGLSLYDPRESDYVRRNIFTSTPFIITGYEEEYSYLNSLSLAQQITDVSVGDFVVRPLKNPNKRPISAIYPGSKDVKPWGEKEIFDTGERYHGKAYKYMFVDEGRIIWLDEEGFAKDLGKKMNGKEGRKRWRQGVDLIQPYMAYGNQSTLEWVYGKGVMVMYVGEWVDGERRTNKFPKIPMRR